MLSVSAILTEYVIVTLSAPRVLKQHNSAWFVIGPWFSRVVSPIVIGVMFLLVVTAVRFTNGC